jgi:hypothetical protein
MPVRDYSIGYFDLAAPKVAMKRLADVCSGIIPVELYQPQPQQLRALVRAQVFR